MKTSVLVAMSGGVDSAVAALLLKEAGHDVVGATMCFGLEAGPGSRAICCGADAVGDARAVCDRIGIAHHVFDYAAALDDLVIARFLAEHLRGRTPNPCVDCNRALKFGRLLRQARALGFDRLATGHYASVAEEGGRRRLLRPADVSKDQTYFLYPVLREDLGFLEFPLARHAKEQVRRFARGAGLRVADKPASQDICFTAGRGCRAFLKDRLGGLRPGPIIDLDGRSLGEHPGLVLYTIGQRVGLGVGGRERRYVVRKEFRTNALVVGRRADLLAAGLVAGEANWLTDPRPGRAESLIRFRGKPIPCRFQPEREGFTVLFDEPQEAISPGQSVVLYQGSVVLGGGVIDHALEMP